jgi:hypothetical protein
MPDEDRMRRIAADIVRDCGFAVDRRQEVGGPSFLEIVKTAVELDRRLATCRAKYQVHMYIPSQDMLLPFLGQEFPYPMFGFDYIESTMTPAIHGEAYKTTSRAVKWRVSLVVTPALVKYGDHEGENYENARVIARRRVMCDK